MKRTEVNTLILDKIDSIEDDDVRGFIDDILRFERSRLDLEQPHYREKYVELLDEHISEDADYSIDD